MKKFIFLFSLIGIICSCSKKSNTTFSGTIDGLRKGTLYLQQIKDSTLITLDSISLNGENNFNFNLNLTEPDVFSFYLDKKDGTIFNDRLKVFLAPGENTLKAKLTDFAKTAEITGSPNHLKLKEYNSMIQKFNLDNFKLTKLNQLAQRSGKQKFVEATLTDYDRFLQRKYLYIINFAINNKNLEIAPYIAVTEIPDANPKFLDTIYKSLPENIKTSKYGLQLKKLQNNN